MYLPVLDRFLLELKERFNARNTIMNAIQACNPHSKYFLDPDSLRPLTENYSIDHQSLEMEAKLAKCTLTGNEQMEMISDVILQLQPIHWFTFCKVH